MVHLMIHVMLRVMHHVMLDVKFHVMLHVMPDVMACFMSWLLLLYKHWNPEKQKLLPDNGGVVNSPCTSGELCSAA